MSFETIFFLNLLASFVDYYNQQNVIYMVGAITGMLSGLSYSENDHILHAIIFGIAGSLISNMMSLLFPPEMRFVVPMCAIVPCTYHMIMNSWRKICH